MRPVDAGAELIDIVLAWAAADRNQLVKSGQILRIVLCCRESHCIPNAEQRKRDQPELLHHGLIGLETSLQLSAGRIRCQGVGTSFPLISWER